MMLNSGTGALTSRTRHNLLTRKPLFMLLRLGMSSVVVVTMSSTFEPPSRVD